MKIAGIFVGSVGGWLVATLIVGAIAFAAPDSTISSVAEGFLSVAPYTGILAIGIIMIAAGSNLYSKAGR